MVGEVGLGAIKESAKTAYAAQIGDGVGRPQAPHVAGKQSCEIDVRIVSHAVIVSNKCSITNSKEKSLDRLRAHVTPDGRLPSIVEVASTARPIA
jgi:hypothetical protein